MLFFQRVSTQFLAAIAFSFKLGPAFFPVPALIPASSPPPSSPAILGDPRVLLFSPLFASIPFDLLSAVTCSCLLSGPSSSPGGLVFGFAHLPLSSLGPVACLPALSVRLPVCGYAMPFTSSTSRSFCSAISFLSLKLLTILVQFL